MLKKVLLNKPNIPYIYRFVALIALLCLGFLVISSYNKNESKKAIAVAQKYIDENFEHESYYIGFFKYIPDNLYYIRFGIVKCPDFYFDVYVTKNRKKNTYHVWKDNFEEMLSKYKNHK